MSLREPRHYSLLCKTVALISVPVSWFFEYSFEGASVWVASYLAAGVVCDALQLVWERLPPEDPEDRPASKRPSERVSMYRDGAYHTERNQKQGH